MDLIQPTSLAQTLDAVSAASFFGRRLSPADRTAAAAWIARRHGQPGAYANTFALFPTEAKEGIRLFTGERVTNASARHIAGQEACRVLRLLRVRSAEVRKALHAASESLAQCVGPAAPAGPRPDDGLQHWNWAYRGGTYCCGQCTVGLWRHLLAGGYDQQQTRLARGLKCLKAYRDGEGKWRKFPFWYTLLALVEMDSQAALGEMRYAAKRCEAATRARRDPANVYSQRRCELAKRVLARI